MKRALITGATGFLGRTVTAELLSRGAEVYTLVLKDDPLAAALPAGAIPVEGDVRDAASLSAFFENADPEACVIHCAGIVSVASKPGKELWEVNVGGTRNVLRMCSLYGVGKLLFVSSVHAIPESPRGTTIVEPPTVSPALVAGEYGKSKAAATRLVLAAAREGLDACVVFPSGIVGPGDLSGGSFTHMLQSFLAGRLPLAVNGGYDFVDVRDVAQGIAACAERGQPGQGYILSGHYVSIRALLEGAREISGAKHPVRCLPLGLAGRIAPFYERHSLREGEKLFFTPYSVAVLASNGHFSHQAATRAFGYMPRPIRTTLRDTVSWLQRGNMP